MLKTACNALAVLALSAACGESVAPAVRAAGGSSGQSPVDGGGGTLMIEADGGEGPYVPERNCPPVDETGDCPAERPTFLCPCTPRAGECRYEENTCGTTQAVSARCDNAVWELFGSLGREDGPAICRVNHELGSPCDLPPDCAQANCYSISCYGRPYVEECVEGVWRTATLCSK